MNDVNEDYTSQLCNGCHGKVVSIYGKGGVWYIFTECDAVYRMRKTLKRDVESAQNIRYIFMEEARHGVRQSEFPPTLLDLLNLELHVLVPVEIVVDVAHNCRARLGLGTLLKEAHIDSSSSGPSFRSIRRMK
ncbi:hypothetical protein Gpo141_00011818 [Globisporangium polare]